MNRGRNQKRICEILTDTICPSRAVSRIASNWDANPDIQEQNRTEHITSELRTATLLKAWKAVTRNVCFSS